MERSILIEKTTRTLWKEMHNLNFGDYRVQYYGSPDKRVYIIIQVSDEKFLVRRLKDVLYNYVKRKVVYPKTDFYKRDKRFSKLGRTDETIEEIDITNDFKTFLDAENGLDDFISKELEKPIKRIRKNPPKGK
jgi:hypothetical protein